MGRALLLAGLLIQASGEPQAGASRPSWIALPAGEAKDLATLLDVVAVGEEIFAVGEGGAFYRYRSGRLAPIESPTNAALTVVWGWKPDEVYAAGLGGTVLLFDGTRVRRLADPPGTAPPRGHSELPSSDARIFPTCLWASSPDDVYLAGYPDAFLHYDGRTWREVGMDVRPVVGAEGAEAGGRVLTPLVGPFWGTSAADVWVRCEVFESASPASRREPLVWHAPVVLHFDGMEWRKTEVRPPNGPWGCFGRASGPRDVIALSPDTIWGLVDDELHLWERDRWRSVTPLPRYRMSGIEWTAAGPGTALADDHGGHLWGWRDGRWTNSPLPSAWKGGGGKIVMTTEGVIARLGPGDRGTLVFAR